MSRTEIAALACRLLALAMFAFGAAIAVPFLADMLRASPGMWSTILFAGGPALFGVAGIWTLFAVYYWQRADVLAGRMVDEDPQPVTAINFTADDVLAVGCRGIGVVLVFHALRSAVDWAMLAGGSGNAAVMLDLPLPMLRAAFDAAIGLGLLFGTKHIVDWLRSVRRLGADQHTGFAERPASAPVDRASPPDSMIAPSPDHDGGAAMLSIEFAALAIRLGALVLYAAMGVFAAGTLLWALLLVYKLLSGSRGGDTFVLLFGVLVPAIVTGILAKYFWRHAENLAIPPHFDPEEWTDAPQGGRELLTAALVWIGAYFLLVGARGLVGAWILFDYHLTMLDAYDELEFDAFTRANLLRHFAGAGLNIVTALALMFAGRRIAERLHGPAAA
jgi:hypothetical protein